jgi:hypothetical protein
MRRRGRPNTARYSIRPHPRFLDHPYPHSSQTTPYAFFWNRRIPSRSFQPHTAVQIVHHRPPSPPAIPALPGLHLHTRKSSSPTPAHSKTTQIPLDTKHTSPKKVSNPHRHVPVKLNIVYTLARPCRRKTDCLILPSPHPLFVLLITSSPRPLFHASTK